ncbi:MAG: SLOG family protein [Planctomycetota bacterium]|jgi:hypothetical protein
MRVAIVGSRGYEPLSDVIEYVRSLPLDTVIITGGAQGVDKTAEIEARARGMEVVIHEAQWNLHGRSAGMIRNRLVVDDCDKLAAFWDQESPGTKGVMSMASKAGKLDKVSRCGNPRQGSLF